MGPAFDIVGIGECMVEFHAEEPVHGAGLFRRGYAGDIANSLVHARRLGLSAAFLSRIGDDLFGSGLVAFLEREGIDLGRAPTVAGDNGLYFIETDDEGERRFAYRRAGSAASGIGPEDLDADLLGAARFVIVSGITQAISASAEALVAAACGLEGAPGRTVYDPNYRPMLWKPRGGLAAAKAAFQAICGRVLWLMPSYPADLPLIDASNMDEIAAIKRFASLSGASVALKLGERGILLLHEGKMQQVPAVLVDRIVDTTGAGDGWNAAFLHGLTVQPDVRGAAAAANAYAARIIGHRGAIAPTDPSIARLASGSAIGA
jgi:2-dehydro-3-deoxygluconokinase